MPAWVADIGSGLAGLFTSKFRTQFERPLAYVKKTLAMATHQSYDDVLETMFNEFMTSAENEHNWQKRLKLCDQLSNLLKIKPEVPRNFWDKTKMILGSIVMAAGSERTQLSGGACKLIGLMFQTLGSQMHPYIETVVPTFLQISGATKKINQVNGNNTMTTIIQFCGYNNRLLYHICATFNDKRKEARAWAPAWLTLFLQTYEHALDPAKDYPAIEKAILTGLNDGDLKTRETTRATYWNFSNINEPATNRIMETLNNHAQNALKSDKNNPHKMTAPAKAAKSGASALAKIRAQNKQQAAVEAQTKGKRDFSDTSIKSQPMIFGSIDRLNDPDGLLKPQNIVGPAETRRLEKQHERLVALGIRDEATPIYETGERTRDPLQLRTKSSKAHISEAKRAKDAEAHPAEPESSTHARPFLSAPVRRPRVVATPMTQPQPTSRPTSKGEATRKPETRDRPQPGRGGRQTPVIVEENFSESQRQPVSKIYKSSAQTEQKSIAGTPSTSRPSSSSSEPAGIRGPRSLTKQSSSTNVLPTRHQKAASASESRGHKSVASSNASMDYSKLKTMSPPGPVMLAFPKPETLASSATTNDKSIDYSKLKTMSPPSSVNLPFSRPETLATSIASSDKSVDYSKLRTMSPPGLVLPFPAKENPVEPHQGKTSADEALSKAKRSLPNIIAALKEGKLDALGYRKLKKLIQNYPGVLFNDSTQDQYDALYRALISQFASIEEAVEPREQKRANFNHPMYSRMAVTDMLHMLMTQYPYGEPEPGMTVVALLIAKASYGEFHTMMEDKIRVSINFFLGAVCHRWSPLPVIDCVTDALFELDQVMRSNEPENVATPTWSRVLDLDRPPRLFMKSVLDARRDQSLRSVDIWPEHGQSVKSQHSVLSEESVMSHISEFGPTPPKLLARLTDVMMLGLNILTFLLNFGRQNGFILYDIQQQRLVGLLTVAVTTYRHLMKENIMEFSAALYDTIKPEERFRSLFENQSDLNLVYYSIAKQKQGGTGSVSGRDNDDAGSLGSNVGLGSLS